MYSVIIINMLTCATVLIFKFYSKSVESQLISGMAVQETSRNQHVSTVVICQEALSRNSTRFHVSIGSSQTSLH